MDDATPGGNAAPLLPRGWDAIEGLVCGFGHRLAAPPPSTLLMQLQVHGTLVVDPREVPGPHGRDGQDGLPRVAVEADALVAASVGLVAGVRTADCVPVLLVAPVHRWAAAVHAGWRGTIGGIAAAAVAAASRAGIEPGELQAALGPSIGPCCYEVSAELGERFAAERLPVQSRDGGRWTSVGKPHLDLRAANRALLERSGVAPERIQDVGPCTRCASDRFHSFRAEPESPGRQVSWIGWA